MGAYPDASRYSIDIFEKSVPNIWSNKKIFGQSMTFAVAEPCINLAEQGVNLKTGHFYVVQVYARDKDGEMLSLSPHTYCGV